VKVKLKKDMNVEKILETVDIINGRVDVNSVHPSKLRVLIEEGYVEEINPGDGEQSFYILTTHGKETGNKRGIHRTDE